MNNHNYFILDEKSKHLGGNLLFGDAASFSPKVFEYVMKRFCIGSVLDIGAGLGNISSYIQKQYAVPVIGVEGLLYNVQNAMYPLVHHDLTKGSFFCPCDLTISVELVEHIEEQYLDNLMKTLCNSSFTLITHALPGQGGQGHVNEQNSDYWITAFEKYGFGLLTTESQIIRNIAAQEVHGGTYFSQSGLLFAKLPKV